MAGQRAGIPNSLTMDLANIFGWDIDFALDIQKGDSFKVMYEELYLEEKMIGTGKILAAEFTNAGKTYKAVRYTDKEGSTNYYTPDGKGMHKAFLRSPIEFARISSHFSLSRKHPVLHIIRAHKGTDYAAARGTPIRATGNGKISFAGRKGGYGNCIVVQHGQGIQTLYGHMNGFAKGMRVGSKVSQGDVIGYVGSTGLASGPHLHYEFHMNGQVRNPVTVPLPKSIGIAQNEMALFTATTGPLLAKLNQLGASQLAMTDSQSPVH
jgi:murein DD-endopeptidase MepM/ murein hydrolase activator NlpD